MYKINVEKNRIENVSKCTFSELQFKERENLQEWIANESSVFGEDLLIIQKEFSGFDKTQERLDLLALDKQGSLVIIENKLDDSGKDVTWQALKYASYCSRLSKENILKIYQDYLNIHDSGKKKAEDNLSEFFDSVVYEEIILNSGVTQRIILVAAKFRKEVTSTVLWLLNFNIRLQCFRATPYSTGKELFLNIEQIIPMQDAEEYMIGMAEKAQDDINSKTEQKKLHVVRKEFWNILLKIINDKTKLYQNISPGVYHWIGAGSGTRGVGLNFVVSKSYGRAEIYIDRGEIDENEFIFDELEKNKESIEKEFGRILVWERLNDKRACRIKVETTGNILERETWDDMVSFMSEAMLGLEKAFIKPLSEINKKLKAKK